MNDKILSVKNLKTYFYTDEGVIPAVDDISFDLSSGETLAIVGESGCGKSVTSLSILRLIDSPPGKIVGGEIIFYGQNLLEITEKEMRSIRGNSISMIFQEPMTSLNPVFTVGYQIIEGLKYHLHLNKQKAQSLAIEMLNLVGIPSPDKCINYYPHQLSGGMRQRVMIAMALSCNPKILIADEPTTALDVTIQAQILRLINDIKRKMDTSVLLITHDLGVVAQIAHKVMVMYAGEIVEYCDVYSIFENPKHPYTHGLLASIPRINSTSEILFNIKGSIPSAKDYPKGCRFSSRCEKATSTCFEFKPLLEDLGNNHFVRCFYPCRSV